MLDGVTPPSCGKIPVTALSDWLADQTGADGVKIDLPVLLSGGAVQQNWALDADFSGGELAGRQQLVLRANFQTPLPASRPKAEEFAILKWVAAAGVTVPTPLFLCEEARVIGQPFFVMQRLTGDASARALVAAAAQQGFGAKLADQLACELALLHTLVPGDRTLAWLDEPHPSSASERVVEYRSWLEALSPVSGIMSEGLDWLERHAPAQLRTCLVHRDFRSGNFLVADGRLTAVLDWEFAGWGDPHEDIGWFCAACWRSGGLEAGGLVGRREFYRAYEAAGGQPVDPAAVAYWEVMAHLRWAIIARQQGDRARQGDAPQHELLEAVARVPGLERDIAAMTGGA